MASSTLMSAAPLGFAASSDDSITSAERLFFASSSSPPLRPSYRTPPRVTDGASRRRPTNRSIPHTTAAAAAVSQSSPVSNHPRFGSPIRLAQLTPPRRSRQHSMATPPTRESQLRARLEPAVSSSAALLGLVGPVTIIDHDGDEFGGAPFGWSHVARPTMGKGKMDSMGGLASLRGVTGDGVIRSRSTPPHSHHSAITLQTPPGPRRPTGASRLVTPPGRIMSATASTARGSSSGLGLGLGFELDVEQDSPATESPTLRAPLAVRPLTESSANGRRVGVSGSMSASALRLAPSPAGLVTTPPAKRKTVNRTSSTEGSNTSCSKPALKASRVDSTSRPSSPPLSTLAPAFDDGKSGIVRPVPTGESYGGVPYFRSVTPSNATPPSSSRLRAKASSGTSPASRAPRSSSLLAHEKPKTSSSTKRASKARVSSPGNGTPDLSPGSTCSAPSLDGSPTSTSSVPSIVITPPAAVSLGPLTTHTQQLPSGPSVDQRRYSGTVLRYEDGSAAVGLDVSPPLPLAAPDQFASPIQGETDSGESSVSSVSSDQTPSASTMAAIATASTQYWFAGHDGETNTDARAWKTATQGMDSDLLSLLEVRHDDEARSKSSDFLASMRFRITLARNTCPTAPGGANAKDGQTPFDCCRWVRGAARAYLHATPPYVEGKGEQRDLLDAAMAKHMEHIVTGIVALLADLSGATPPHDMPLWLAELCAGILSELCKLDDGYIALPPLVKEAALTCGQAKDIDVVESLGHMLLGSPAKLKDRTCPVVEESHMPHLAPNQPPPAPRKKLSTLFLEALSFELDTALSFGVTVREQALRLAVPVPVKKVKRRAQSSTSCKGAKGRKAQGEVEPYSQPVQPASDLILASKGEISAEELRRRERRRAAVGHAKDSFTSLNTVRFVGELYRVQVLPLEKLQAWLERLILDTVYPGVPSAFELEATCALVLTVGPTLEVQAQLAERHRSQAAGLLYIDVGSGSESSNVAATKETTEPQTPAAAARASTHDASPKMATPGPVSSDSSPQFAFSLKSQSLLATPRSDGAPPNHWIHCSPSAARRLHGRCSNYSLRQAVLESSQGQAQSSSPIEGIRLSHSTSSDLSLDLSQQGTATVSVPIEPTPSSSPSELNCHSTEGSPSLIDPALQTLDSTLSRLTEVLNIQELHEDGRLWIEGVLSFRAAGWKSPRIDEGEESSPAVVG